MIAFPSMLLEPAQQAGMKTPVEDFNEDNLDLIKETHPHFFIFCLLQLGRAMQPGEQWENAKIIANISENKIKKMTVKDFEVLGFRL